MKHTKVANRYVIAVEYSMEVQQSLAADPVIEYMTRDQLQQTILKLKKDMEKAAKELDFIEAARLRDEMFLLEKKLNNN